MMVTVCILINVHIFFLIFKYFLVNTIQFFGQDITTEKTTFPFIDILSLVSVF